MFPLLCAALLLATPEPDRVQSLRDAAALIQNQQFDQAESILKPLLAANPKDALALNLLGVVRAAEHDPGAAEKLFRQSIDTGHPLAGPHMNLAKLYASNRPDDAINQLAEALKASPGNREAVQLLRDISRSASSAALRSGDPQKAVRLALAASNAKPHDPELLYDFGMAASDAGLKKEAEQSLHEAMTLQPAFYDAEYALARVELDDSNAAEAEKLIRNYLRARSSDASAQYALGRILLAEEKTDEAKTAFERSLELQPQQTESAFEMGDIAQQQGNALEARRWFDQVLSRDPHHAGALTGAAVADYREGNFERARGELELAIAAAPNYQKAHYYYALVLNKLGRKDEAAREFATSRSLEKTQLVRPALAVTPK